MGQIRALAVNWLEQARRLSELIAGMPGNPPGLLASIHEWPALPKSKSDQLLLLQETISLHLTYRLHVSHKIKIKKSDGSSRLFNFSGMEPANVAHLLDFFIKNGAKFSDAELAAFKAHARLSRILADRYVCAEWKADLPLLVASIGGEALGTSASLKAQKPRIVDRRSALTRVIAEERKRDSAASAYEVLNRICNGSADVRDVVKQYKNEVLTYYADDGSEKSITLKSYLRLFSEQKPSLG